ncbi:MAG TPA: WecB/TagA/CpsF family glycosyltransferase, partial [Candidatus Baltobacteraceae bacterium]|nr:WecB/TagA/CpsF family glycosyltransferase [Candidatus Baltobacteraceae bacterium]
MDSRLTIAGVPVDPVTMKEARARASGFLGDGRQHFVVTPNPEMAVLADRDPGFRKILEASDLALPDGFGLRLAGLIEGKRIPETVTGAEFTLVLAYLAEQKNCSVYLLGAGRGVAEEAAKNLVLNFPELKIAGAEQGGSIRWIAGKWEEEADLASRISAAKPDILFVALGHGKQERWIRDHLPKLPSVKIAMGIGGTLDFLAGRVWRAPVILRRMHLEWLWRLCIE